MNCCCCCTGGGIVLPIGPLLWACGAVWVAENIVAVLIVCAVCGLLALVASILLLRWADRRDAARMAAWRARRAQIGKPITVLRAEVVEHPAGTYGLTEAPMFRPSVPPALGPPPKSWLCETCYWAWPLDLPFCGVCGHSRSVTGADREVVIRQAINGRN